MLGALWVRGRYWVLAFGVVAGCGKAHELSGFGAGEDGGSDSPVFGGDDGSLGSSSGIVALGPATDFPNPVLDANAPSNAASLFSGSTAATSGGPCLVEPEANVLYPQNWLNPRFRWTAAGTENLFELRLHVGNQTSDLVVYTNNTTWTMPTPMWDALRNHSAGEPMTITLTGAMLSGTSLQGTAIGSQTPMGVAPVQATGAIVYWALDSTV